MKLTKLDKAAEIAIKICMNVKPKENILVISDFNKREIGLALHLNALRLGYSSLYLEMKPGKRNGEEPLKEVAELMKKFDVIFCPTTTSLTHTDARRKASALGVRIATFPGITKEVMIRGLNADYNKIAKLSIKLKKVLSKGKFIRVTTQLGTDVSFEFTGRTPIASKGLFHNKGESGNLPTGETYLAPLEGTTNGKLVIDGSIAALGLLKNKNVIVDIKDGYAKKFYGSDIAKKLFNMLSEVGKDAFNIAEFGIGTNDSAKLSGILLEDEKVMGTIHFAFGNNKSMGGKIGVPIHIDGVVKKPTVYLDKKLLMRDGKLLI
ncbi:MAG: aminopeptidase [Ignavibacterium sp.]